MRKLPTIDLHLLNQKNVKEFNRLFKQEYPFLFISAARYVGRELAGDIVSDTCVNLWTRAWPTFSRIEDLLGYLYTAVRNAAFDYLRSEDRRPLTTNLESVDLYGDGNLETLLLNRDLLQLVAGIVATMPPQMQQVFRLKYYEDRIHKDIAATMEIGIPTVQGHIRDGKKFLRAALKKKSIIIGVILALLLLLIYKSW